MSIIERLRSETAPIHRQLEALPLSQALLSPSVMPEEYAAYLTATYGLLDFMEEHFFPVIADLIPDIEKRKRAPLILSDLQSLGFLPENLAALKSEARFFSYFQYPETASPAYTLGVLYVTEGSTLGGRVILKNISKSLRLDTDAGTSYFAGYGDNTGLKWKTFLQILTSYAYEHGGEEQMVKGAENAFQAFYHTLSLRQS